MCDVIVIKTCRQNRGTLCDQWKHSVVSSNRMLSESSKLKSCDTLRILFDLMNTNLKPLLHTLQTTLSMATETGHGSSLRLSTYPRGKAVEQQSLQFQQKLLELSQLVEVVLPSF